MLDTSNVLVNKLVLRILRPEENTDALDVSSLILNIIFRQMCNCFDTMLEWRSFARGGSYSNCDNSLRGISALTQSDDGTVHWAANFYVKDQHYSRRRWKYYLAIIQSSDNEANLYYAKCKYDHMAGSFSPGKSMVYTRDTLLDPLFTDPSIICMVGNHYYPVGGVNLNEANLSEFIALVQDEKRNIPAMLITCPDVITPEKMADETLGNLAVYWCDESRTIMELNVALPRDLRTPWDAVRVFMPIANSNIYHPCFTYEEIHRMGVDRFFAGIRQAYCESMHSEERRSFPTVSEILSMRDREYIRKLEALNQDQAFQINDAKRELEQQSHDIQPYRERIGELKNSAKNTEVAEMESLLSDSMAETDALRRSISALSTTLYSTMGIGFQPDQSESIALIQELSHAIYASLQCAQGKRRT